MVSSESSYDKIKKSDDFALKQYRNGAIYRGEIKELYGWTMDEIVKVIVLNNNVAKFVNRILTIFWKILTNYRHAKMTASTVQILCCDCESEIRESCSGVKKSAYKNVNLVDMRQSHLPNR